jgi:hypothetical protein
MISIGKHNSDKHGTQTSEHCSRHSLVDQNTSRVLLIIPLKFIAIIWKILILQLLRFPYAKSFCVSLWAMRTLQKSDN